MSQPSNETKTPSSSLASDEEMRKLLKPSPSADDILKVLRSSYCNDGDDVKVSKQLESYDDCNYLVEINNTKYIVKVHNGVESGYYTNKKNDDGCHIDLMKKIFRHLNKPEFKVKTSLPMPTTNVSKKDGEHSGASTEDGFSSIHKLPVVSASHSPHQLVVQLLEYIEGIPMSSCRSLSIETIASAGIYLGRVCVALDDLTNNDEQACKIANHYHAWDGKNTLDIRKFVQYIDKQDRREMVQSVLDKFETTLVKGGASEQFRKGILQSDFNDANIIMKNDINGEIAGVIDFGDSTLSWRVLDISVAMTYAMLSVYGKANRGLSAAAAMLRGFHSIYPLTSHEQKHLRLLIAARLSCSATLGAYSYHMNPSNKYLLLHAEPAWTALDLIWGQCCKNPGMASTIDNLFYVACKKTSTSSGGLFNCTDLSIPDPCVVDLLESVRKHGGDTSEPPEKRTKIQEETDTKPSITFVTGNKKKLEEVKRILQAGDGKTEKKVEQLSFVITNQKIDLPELQGSPVEIAKEKCSLAAKEVGGAVITEDTSLCFNALNNLPGPYIKWFLDDCGLDGLNNMIAFSEDKTGYAQTVVAFCPGPGEDTIIFDGRTHGLIVPPRGKLDFGWDPIFQPDESGGLTYAEMSKEGKDAISHRSRAFLQLRDHLSKEADTIKAKIK
mmetsp:Transcript_13079/g.19526  ORF Transcript_13079/g.19526 Transcript_13079/m.19526 type:complete len:668 (-) Transcript_13079:35-2038(-)